MKYYYLINGKIMWSYEKMPTPNTRAFYTVCLNEWKHDLQPCEISESELEEIYRYLLTKYGIDSDEILNPTPIEITDIVYGDTKWSKEQDCVIDTIKFKQPKKVEEIETNNFIETYDKEWIIGFVTWYSGMNNKSVNQAFQRYIDEVILNNK